MDRPQAPGKPIDPATRLSELLAQSLEELTRPFDAPRGHPSRPREDASVAAAPEPAIASVATAPSSASEPEANPEQARIDADKALAELEAELFAAAKQVDRDASIPHAETDETEPHEPAPTPASVETVESEMAALLAAHKADEGHAADATPEPVPFAAGARAADAPEAAPDADAARLVAKVRKLMLVSMAVTIIAVGSVFGFIGYRIMKGEGATAKIADKLPPASAIPTDVTLSIPRNARVVQSAVANDRLVLTLDIDGKIEVRTFDVRTLQPTGRLNFSATP